LHLLAQGIDALQGFVDVRLLGGLLDLRAHLFDRRLQVFLPFFDPSLQLSPKVGGNPALGLSQRLAAGAYRAPDQARTLRCSLSRRHGPTSVKAVGRRAYRAVENKSRWSP
jgi:hypothetical protein